MPGEEALGAAAGSATPWGAIIGGGLGLAKTVIGLINSGKAKKTAAELDKTRPKYKENQVYDDDLSLAESELASGGLSSKAETAYNNVNNQQFSSSLSAILKGGGSVNNVADVFGANETGRQRLAMLNDQMRLSQIDRLMRARKAKADDQEKAWQINKFAPWQDKARAVAGARKGAEDGIWSGLGTIGAAGMEWADENNQKKMFDEYLNGSGFNQTGYSNGTATDRGTIQYSEPDLSTGNRPIPRNQPAVATNGDNYDFFNDPNNWWFEKR